jgi:trimethylamine--corrinoid protein Co-methyltransferase
MAMEGLMKIEPVARHGKLLRRQVLSEDEINSVRQSSLAVLEEVGILIEHPRALTLLAEAGATVNPDSHHAKIPASLVEKSLRTVPSEFLLTGQHPSKDVVLSHQSPPQGRPVMSLDWIVDYGVKRRREVTRKDLEAWVRVVDALPNLALVTGVYPWDVPLATRDVWAAEAMLRLSTKPILMAPYSGRTVEWVAQMLGALPDQRAPKVIIFSSCNSPLIYSQSQMDGLLAAADHDLPVMVNSSAVTGATAPITLAGTLVIMNAEILAGAVVAQLAKPGTKVIYAGHPVVLDMHTSIASMGYTEIGLLAAALVDLGRSYGIPTASNGLTTDSHACDEQAALEKLITGYLAVLSGAALNGGAGSLAAVGTASLEQLVIDDDIYERILRMCQGIDINPDTLGLEVIAAVGPNRQFLAEPHTLKYLRREFCPSKLATRLNAEAWMEGGAKESTELAADRVKVILKGPPEPHLEPRVLSELSRIVALAEEEKNNPA